MPATLTREPYASVDDYRAAARKIDPADDTIIKRDLVAVTRLINDRTGRDFGVVNAAIERRFYGDGTEILRVDDIASTTNLAIKIDEDGDGVFTDETALASTDYQLLPLNAATYDPPEPYREILLPRWSSRAGYWPRGVLVSVTALWGWPAVPENIIVATIELTRILRIEGPRATNRMDEAGNILFLSRDAQARNIINDLIFEYGFKAVVA